MHISASNFSSAPTGPSIDRFFAPAAAAAAAAAESEQQQQDPEQRQSHQHSSPGITGLKKRPAAANVQPPSKQARSEDKQQGALARFLAGAQGSAGTGTAAEHAADGAGSPLLQHVAPSHAAAAIAVAAADGCVDDAVGAAGGAVDSAAAADVAAADAAAGLQQEACAQPSHRPQQPLHLHGIDAEVLAALPWDIQMEVQQQLRAASRAATAPAGRGSSSSGGSNSSRGGGRRGGRGGRGNTKQPAGRGIAAYFKS
jgi:hypothetical protein